MFQKLVSHNDDIRRLVDRGYAIAFDSNHLVIRDIPYLDEELRLQHGAIVTKLEFVDQVHVTQTDHQIFFAGSVPHNLDRSPIPHLGGGPTGCQLSELSKDVVVQRSFSNKPVARGKFVDFFEKVESYVTIISGPAIELHKASPFTFRTIKAYDSTSVFKFHDTLTSRAEIAELAKKFDADIVAIIGLGGTGAYVLDFMVKTPVKEIRAFDLDNFHVHNTFRSPGSLNENELGKTKAAVYAARYDNFRHGLTISPKFVDTDCVENFTDVTFAFVCVDKGSARRGIFDLLISKGIPFIDVGMGLHRKAGPLTGMLRTTYYSKERAEQTCDEGHAELTDGNKNIYQANIQIGELNALNACMAVVQFKQLRGFYDGGHSYYNTLFDLHDLKTVGLELEK